MLLKKSICTVYPFNVVVFKMKLKQKVASEGDRELMSLTESNFAVIDLIKKNEPFSIVRFGIGQETYMTHEWSLTKNITTNYFSYFSDKNHWYLGGGGSGIYTKANDMEKMKLFARYYDDAVTQSDSLACFETRINKIQNYYSSKYNLPQIHSRVLEPFYIMQQKEIPWTHHLKGKKVLVINAFVDSFQKQLKNGFKLTDNDTSLFHDDQEFVFYKTFQTMPGHYTHNDWFETFNVMCEDIKTLDFDVALLGCGGYGLPLCHFIKMKLNKSAIYIGGGLQLLFGVKGKRWNTHPVISNIIKENGKFISPSGDEVIENKDKIEGGCYW